MAITEEYLASLAPIYRDVLAAFPHIEPTRKWGYGLSIPTIFGALEEQGRAHKLGEVLKACDNLAQAGAVELKHRIFVHPTEMGEALIEALSESETVADVIDLPAFFPPRQN